MTVISGHQRLKACKELGIDLVPIMIRDDLTDENEKLKLLLAANFGRTKNDDAKQRKIATEYVALCGNSHGGNRKSNGDNRHLISQDEIAEQLGVSPRTLREMLAIESKLTPEIKELLGTGVFTKTTASKILTKLSPDEQKELAKSLPVDTALTQEQVNTYVEKIKSQENQIAGYEAKMKRVDELKAKIQGLEEELANRPVETVEVKPADYDDIAKDNARLNKENRDKCNELARLKKQLELAEAKTAQKQAENKLIDDSFFFCSKVETFIRDVGGLAYLAVKINDLREKERTAYLKAVNIVEAWAQNIKGSIYDNNPV